MSRDTHEMEKLLFIEASNRLTFAYGQGQPISGLEALLETYNSRTPDSLRPFNILSVEKLSNKDRAYFRKMGAYVELAVELNETVDQQR